MKKAFFISLALATYLIGYAQKTKLGLNLVKGETYTQTTNSKALVIQEVNGQKIELEMVVGGSMAFKVTDVTDAGFKMDATFTDLKMVMNMPTGSVEFSSKNPDESDMLSAILSKMTSKPFQITMSKAGKVTDVRNVNSLWEEAINELEGVDDMQRRQIVAQISQAYGNKALKGNIEMVTAIYPNKAVKPGDKWTIKTKLESGMSADLITEYEFVKIIDDMAIIKGVSTISTADKDAYIDVNGMPLKYDLDGSMLSNIEADKNSGWIKYATVNQEMEGTASIKPNEQIPDGMDIPITMKNELIVSDM